MKVNFWFLDINQEVVEGQVEIWIWGIDEAGRRILIIDRNFKPSIYLLPKNNKTSEIVRWVKGLGVDEVKVEDKKYFGFPVKAIKISTRDVEKLKKIADEASKNPLVKEVLHDDIRSSSLYLIEYDIKPCGWHSIEVEEVKKPLKAKVEKIYFAKSKPNFYEKFEPPKLRTLIFYPVYHTDIGSPHPERDPVLTISTITSDDEKRIFKAVNGDDCGLLKEFISYIQQYDPDLIVSYNSNRIHIPYLLQRSKKLGVDFLIDRVDGEPHQSVYGHISITGRLHVDLYDIVEDIPEVKVKTLENFAEYLGVHKNLEVVKLRETDIHKCWVSEKEKVVKFCEYCAILVKRISDNMLDYVFQLSNLVGIPADYVFSAAVGFRVDWYLIRKAFIYNELIPKRVEQEYYTYKGGMVLEPKPGIHENIAVFDFSSMYPNLMVKYNLSPDTYVRPDEKFEGEVYIAPEVNHKFKANPPGFYKQVLLELMDARRGIQEKLKKLSYNDPLYKVLDARQRGIKVITNATYGYCGWRGARWYVNEVAEATAAWGRKTIGEAISIAKKHGLEVVYGDTDSVFVKYDKSKVNDFLNEVKERTGLEIRPDTIYRRLLFTEAKKRYAGLLPDGRIEIVGLEVARGDWCEAAKEIQEKVLEIILKENNPNRAADMVREYVEKLKEDSVSNIEPFIIWKTITKPLNEYQVKAPHVEAAKRMLKSGWNLTVGDKVGYVIVKGLGKLYERAYPYFMVNPKDIDISYYIENQIIPAALRVLEIFGISRARLGSLKPSKIKDLSKFFG